MSVVFEEIFCREINEIGSVVALEEGIKWHASRV
jgi:hypothetical protein